MSLYLSASLEMLNKKKSANERSLSRGQGSPGMDCGPNPAHRAYRAQAAFANKVLLALSHAHWFAYGLRLLSHHKGRIEPV